MEFEKIHNKGQARLFKNSFLEMLTKTHPLVIWGMYLPVMVYMLYYSSTALIIQPQGSSLLLWAECFSGRFLNI